MTARAACAALLLAASPALAAPGTVVSVPVPRDTLHVTADEAVRRALANGVDARVAQANVGIYDGEVREAMAQALPQIAGTVTYNRKFSSIFQGLSADTLFGPLFSHSSFAAVHGWTAELTATQTLWSSGRVGAGLAAARAVRNSVRATRDEALADVALQARRAYLEAVYAREVLAIAREGLEQAQAHLAQVKLLRGQGSRSEYDLLQAQVDAANQEPAVVAADNAARQAVLQLERVINVPLGQPLALDTPLAFDPARVPVLDADPGDGTTRPALRSADDMVTARRQALRAEAATRWPTLSASATVSHQAFPTDVWPTRREFTRGVDGSIKLAWPLFQGFRTFGAVQRAGAELAQARAERDRTREGLALEVEQARQDVQRTLTTLAARRGTAELARRAHHLATVRWQNGLSTQLEVSDARLQLQTAEVNEVAAAKDYRVALLQLERATNRPLPLSYKSIDELSSTLINDGGR
jgi:outer membrane protein TolC